MTSFLRIMAPREAAIAAANVLLLLLLAGSTHGFFTPGNLSDLFLANMPVLLIALGMMTVIVSGQIDISVGSIFAVCSVVAGAAARDGVPVPLALLLALCTGAACGALNGVFTAYLRVPSIVVTLATMVALRDGLRWWTQGAWISNLPPRFLRFGMAQHAYTLLALVLTALLVAATAWCLRSLQAGRAIFATGSNHVAAHQLGIDTRRVTLAVFVSTGVLTAFAATLNAVRFGQVPSNSGLGLELKVIAAVVVGGAAITGGSGTVLGTVLGVILLGIIGPALTFAGISAYWEQAIQGAIILVAVSATALGRERGSSPGGVAIAG